MRAQLLVGTALSILVGLSPALAASGPRATGAQQTPPPAPPAQTTTAAPAPAPQQPAPAPAATAAAADETVSCGDCHDDQMKAFRTNPHAHGAGAKGAAIPNAVCETCHGPGKAHIEGGGDKTLIFKPAGRAGSDKACLKCHDTNTDRTSRHSGMHANSAAVNCLTCHSVHHSAPNAPHLLANNELALCNTCHSNQVSSFRNKPFAHRLGRGGMGCASCHEPHGRPGRESVRQTRAGEMACLNCHIAQRGPFVFQHASVVIGDCTTCHETHGSSNPKQLKRANVFQLCLECHSPITSNTLGSQPPAFHNLSDPRYQNCTTCHVAIHGSNRSPQLFK